MELFIRAISSCRRCSVPIVLTALASPAYGVVSVDYVDVANAGNAADTTGYGAVGYDYRIARNETTIGEYVQFLNAVAATDTYGLYSSNMGSIGFVAGIARSGSSGSYTYTAIAGTENKPITYVSWFDAARYANWLHNGQPTGSQNASTTEDGAYTLNGATTGTSVSRNVGATVWIPSENEWYKAAYYDPTKNTGVGGYWLHANQSDSLTSNTVGAPGAGNINDGDFVGFPGMALTDVGAYGAGSDSFYGLNDMTGNVMEWNEAVLSATTRGIRGGAWSGNATGGLATARNNGIVDLDGFNIGFRVASVPEPGAMVLAIFACGFGLVRRKR